MKRFILSFFLYCFYCNVMFSQNESTKWYFGNKAGLDFMTNPPTVLSNGQIHAGEGCTSIADANGNLLFYTMGDTIWNSLHQIMPNSTGIFAHYSVTQASLIVKKPGSANIFYLFTLYSNPGYPPTDLYYSVIDMNLASGTGSVTVKNATLQTNCNEKMAAVKHCNGNDVWLLLHEYNSSTFFSYLIGTSGINTTPILSNVSPVESSFSGQLKISPSGKKIGLASNTSSNDKFMLYDFDPSTGSVSNPLSLMTSTKTPYGCEFSPDGSKFYGAFVNGPLPSQLVQWDLCAGSATAVVSSSFVTTFTPTQPYGALQLAKDGKIYFAAINQGSISVIQNPNTAGAGCNFSQLGQSVLPMQSKYGLPNFVSSYFYTRPTAFSYSVGALAACKSVSFSAPALNLNCSVSAYQSLSWLFADPASGPANTSTQLNPVHVFSGGGTYPVKLLLHNACGADTITQIVSISAPLITISGTFSLCPFQSTTLSASGANSYSWGTGQQSASISISPSVTVQYSVTGTNTLNGCSSSKSVTVTVYPCAGIENVGPNQNFISISPNPNDGRFSITLSESASIELIDLWGKSLLSGNYLQGKHDIDLSQHPNGLYILRVKTKEDSQVYRLVKHN